MYKNFKFKIFILFLLFIFPISVFAHPGRTDENGCHVCRTNCNSWGLSYGQYHCHNGNTKGNIKEAKTEARTSARTSAKK